MKKRFSLLITHLTFCVALFAQAGHIIIEKLIITGNEKTKEAVIRRELPFAAGDTIPLSILAEKLKEGEQQLMNTNLFTNAKITYAQWEGATQKVHLKIEVKETWFIYPIPVFELADRNFNVWWREYNHSLKRVNIGMEFKHINVSGWRDKLEVEFQTGFTRSYKLQYHRPYINKKRTLGVSALVKRSQNREMAYVSLDNKQIFHRNDDHFIRDRWRFESKLSWRPKYYGNHTFALSYFNNWVDTIVTNTLNPDYFANDKNTQRFSRFFYSFTYDKRDNHAYPWNGYNLEASVEKDGLGIHKDINALTLRLNAEHYWAIKKRWSLGLGLRTKYSLIRETQAYANNFAIGHGRDKISGYELYVVDGLDMALFRSNLRFEIWESDVTFGKIVFIEAFRHLPFRINAILSSDLGYVNSPFNQFENKFDDQLLWGGGIGLDFVFYYNFVFRTQYSINELKERGFFLEFKIGI